MCVGGKLKPASFSDTTPMGKAIIKRQDVHSQPVSQRDRLFRALVEAERISDMSSALIQLLSHKVMSSAYMLLCLLFIELYLCFFPVYSPLFDENL